MRSKNIRRLTTAGLLLAAGLLLPFLTSHAFGVPGTILLPMHIPVLLCGLLCGPRYGALCGLLVPVLSSALTGMPAPYPMLPIMATQLVVLGLVSGLVYHTLKRPILLALPVSILCGWVTYGLVFAGLLLAGGTLKALSVSAAVIKGIPGMAIQLVLLPILVGALERYRSRRTAFPDTLLTEAVRIIKSREASCVVIQGGAIVHTADGRGVSPLLRLYRENPALLRDAVVADKIIGKAAAMILLLGGAKSIYGEVMSVAARDYLEKNHIPYQFGRCVDVITSRDKTGICPIEKSVLEIDDPTEGFRAITATIEQLMKAAV